MKKLIILLIVSAAVFNIYSQTITQEFKDSVLVNLYSPDLIKRGSAILDTYINDIPEAIPILESIIWEQDRYLGANVLDALAKYDSSNYITIANQFFDAVDTMRTELQTGLNRSPVEIKKDILFNLFVKGDYSKTNFLFELIEMKKPGSFLGVTFLLQEVLNNVSEYYQQAKNELFRIAPWDGVALLMISDRYGSEANEVAYQAFLGAKDPADRGIALDHLVKHNYIGLEILIKNRVFVDTVWTSDLVNTLLNKFGSPPNYKFIKDNYDQVNNVEEKRRINFTIEWFKPTEPDSSVMCEILVQAIIETIDSTYYYTWLGDLAFSNELKNILTTAKTNLQNGDSLACRVQVKAFQDLVDNVYKDSLNADARFVTIEGWKFLYWNAQYILDRLPEPPANPNLVVNLKNSLGNQIPASNVKYYEGSWKDAVNNGDGTFTVITTRPTVSIRVFYEYASQQVDNVPAQNNTYTFTTANAAVQLKNSLGSFIDAGTVQYYAGAWRTFGTTSNGVAYKELLPINYSFRMTYEYGSIDKQQNLSTDPIVVFQTVNAAVQLKNSLGNLIDLGTVQYYAGAWRSFGTTSPEGMDSQNGVVYKELLPINYSFRMTYEFVSKDKQQNLGTNPVVDFNTVLCSVKVSKTSNNQPINNATVKYYAGAWRNLGTTNVDGITIKELLPANLSFRATYGSVSLDKQQDISVNNLVEILLDIP